MIEKVKRTAIEQREILDRREERLHLVKWVPETSPQRREAIAKLQSRIWREMRELAYDAQTEEQDMLWPEGLPAHP